MRSSVTHTCIYPAACSLIDTYPHRIPTKPGPAATGEGIEQTQVWHHHGPTPAPLSGVTGPTLYNHHSLPASTEAYI